MHCSSGRSGPLLSHWEGRGYPIACAEYGFRIVGSQATARALRENRKIVLPQELETCELTGLKVSKANLKPVSFRDAELCAIVFFAVKFLVSTCFLNWLCDPASAIKYALPKRQLPVSGSSNRSWPVRQEFARRTGLTIAGRFLNDRGEFTVLRQLLDGSILGKDSPELIPWLQLQRPGIFGSLKSVSTQMGPASGVRLACCELRTFFGLKVRYAGVLIRDRGERQLLGRGTIGRRTPDGWIPEQDF